MKRLLPLLLLSCFACSQSPEKESAKTDQSPAPGRETVADRPATNKQKPAQQPERSRITASDMEMTDSTELDSLPTEIHFIYEDEKNLARQDMTVEWISEDSIQFDLHTENGLCTYSLSGTAVEMEDGDLEMDEDKYGNAFPVSEYILTKEAVVYSIRIAYEDRELASITLDNIDDECSPETEVMTATEG